MSLIVHHSLDIQLLQSFAQSFQSLENVVRVFRVGARGVAE